MVPVMDARSYHTDVQLHYRKYKQLAEQAMSQVSDEDFFHSLDDNPNSIAHIVKHLSGNMRSRWLNFLTSDGEKPDRHRDTEFEITAEDSRTLLLQFWESSWQTAFSELEALSPEAFERTVTVRNEKYLVFEAINRNLLHCAYHAGQIVHLSRYFAGDKWQTLSIPLGQSTELNRRMRESGGTSHAQKQNPT